MFLGLGEKLQGSILLHQSGAVVVQRRAQRTQILNLHNVRPRLRKTIGDIGPEKKQHDIHTRDKVKKGAGPGSFEFEFHVGMRR